MIAGGVVDAHLHFWDLERFRYPWLDEPSASELRRTYLYEDFVLDSDSVEVAAVVHVQAELDHAVDPALETAWVASTGAPAVCVGYADLRSPDLDDVLDRHLEHPHFRGIRQLAWYDPRSDRADVPRHNLLDDQRWIAGLRRVAERELTFDLQVWPWQLPHAARILRDLPTLRVIVEHTGLPGPTGSHSDWAANLGDFAHQIPRAALKVSALRSISPEFDLDELRTVALTAIELFGVDRCRFGSNFPVDAPATSYARFWSVVDDITSGFSDSERTALFRTNAATAYGIALPDLERTP
jgi:predicted TIM-barrel fold metal-dependent hydrolase